MIHLTRSAPLSALLLASLLVCSQGAAAQVPRPAKDHPLLGKWTWTRSENKCTEVYDFRADGTVPVISGAERTENTYTVSPQPDARGFYLLTMLVTKDNGGKDCADDATSNVGQDSTTFVLFEPRRAEFIMCAEPSLNACFGPLRRATN